MASAKSETVKTAVPRVDEAIDAGIAVAETVVKSNTEAARKGLETVASMGREAIGAACEAGAGVKGFEKAADLPRANFEAAVEAGSAFARGVEAINGRLFEIARARAAEGAEARKAVFGAGTVQEAIDIQWDIAAKSFDRAVRDGIEMSGAWMTLAAETGAPIGRRVSDAIAEVGRKAA